MRRLASGEPGFGPGFDLSGSLLSSTPPGSQATCLLGVESGVGPTLAGWPVDESAGQWALLQVPSASHPSSA